MPKKKTPTLYKAVRPDGMDFATETIDYGTAYERGETVKHPNPGPIGATSASAYLSVTVDPVRLPGSSWPLRLFEVEAVGEMWNPNDSYPAKRAVTELRLVREVSPNLSLGPEGDRVAELVEQFKAAGYALREAMYGARRADHWGAYNRAYNAAGSLGVGSYPARFGLGLRGVGWAAGLGGALALLVRGIDPSKITDEDYETLSHPWRTVMGPVSPKDNLPAKGFTPKKSRGRK